MNATEKRFCPSCGNGFDAPVGVRGRPQVFCSPLCKKIEQLFSWMEDEISKEDFDPVHSKIKEIRRRLFYLSNLLNAKSHNQKTRPNE